MLLERGVRLLKGAVSFHSQYRQPTFTRWALRTGFEQVGKRLIHGPRGSM
jgi:hypothetical protein